MDLNITERRTEEKLRNTEYRKLTDSLKRQEAGLCEEGYEISGSEKSMNFLD
jgi:hypothetical protein